MGNTGSLFWIINIPCVSRNAIIYSPLLLGLNLFKYWWSLTHSLPRHGRFWYLKEILIKSQYSAQQSHPKSDVKIKNISNSMILPENKFQKSDSMSSRHDKNHIKDSFENLRTWGNHKPHYFFLKSKIWPTCCENASFFFQVWAKYCWYPYFWHLT